MADGDNLTTAAVSTATTSPQSTSKKEKKNKQPRSKPSHPPTADMVINAIKSLKERGGSSLQAIKKYISTNYKVDAEKIAPFIKKYLKSAVISGKLIQTKGKGASGSFKLASVTSMAGNKPLTTKKKPTSPKIKKIQKKSSTKKVIVGSDNKSLISKKTSIKNRKVSSVGNVAEGKTTLKKKTLVGTEKKGKRIISNVDKKTSIGGSASTTVKETVKVKSPSSKARKTTKAGIAIKKLKVPKPKSTKNVSGASKVKKVASPKKKK